MQSESQNAALCAQHDFSSNWRAFVSSRGAPGRGLPGTKFPGGKIDCIEVAVSMRGVDIPWADWLSGVQRGRGYDWPAYMLPSSAEGPYSAGTGTPVMRK